MKKLLILALVALVAGSAFAMTDPAFTGEFEFYSGFDFTTETAEFGDSGEAKIALNGVVDEYSTVNAELGAEVTDDDSVPVTLDDFTMTTDLTGALGVAGPVGLAITWGFQSYEADNFAEVAGYEDLSIGGETGTYLGTLLVFTFADMLTVKGVLYPGTYTDWDGVNEAVGAVEVIYAMDAISANLWFVYDGNAGPIELGTTVGYVTDLLEVGFGAEYDLTTEGAEEFLIGLGFLYNVTDALGVGLAFATEDMLNGNFASTTQVALNAVFDATDIIQLYASAVLMDFSNIMFAFDAGVAFAIGGVTYTVGYDYNGADFKTPDWGLTEGLYIKVSASF